MSACVERYVYEEASAVVERLVGTFPLRVHIDGLRGSSTVLSGMGHIIIADVGFCGLQLHLHFGSACAGRQEFYPALAAIPPETEG